jgi:hypothetical protein
MNIAQLIDELPMIASIKILMKFLPEMSRIPDEIGARPGLRVLDTVPLP